MNIKDLKDKFCDALLDKIDNICYPEPELQGASQYHLEIYHAQEAVRKIDRAAFELYMHEMISETVDDLIKSIKFKP